MRFAEFISSEPLEIMLSPPAPVCEGRIQGTGVKLGTWLTRTEGKCVSYRVDGEKVRAKIDIGEKVRKAERTVDTKEVLVITGRKRTEKQEGNKKQMKNEESQKVQRPGEHKQFISHYQAINHAENLSSCVFESGS
jgi:hypothetical protein